jgi:Cu2+-containing amine oxidase
LSLYFGLEETILLHREYCVVWYHIGLVHRKKPTKHPKIPALNVQFPLFPTVLSVRIEDIQHAYAKPVWNGKSLYST